MSRRRQSPEAPAYDPNLSHGIIAILLVMLAILVTLSFFDSAGAVGIALNEYILASLFGNMRYATPFVILTIAWFLIRDLQYNYRATHGIGALLFFLTTSSLFHLHFLPQTMWHEALSGHGGGIFGMPAYLLQTYVGTIGSYVILLSLLLISILLMFNTAITAFVLLHRKILNGCGIFGQALVSAVRALFVKKDSLDVNGEYEESDETESEEETNSDSEIEAKPKFFSRPMPGTESDPEESEKEENEPEDDESEEKVETVDSGTSDTAGPWSKKVVIKNLPNPNLLSDKRGKPTSGDIKANAQMIQDTLHEFNIDVEMGEIRVGPTVTQYSLKPNKGVKLSRITTLSNDLALSLAAHPIRIEAPIPGKSLVGIEVPNQKTAMVSFKELLEGKEFTTRQHNLMVGLGKDVAGRVWWADLPRMPHLLIAGATGSGKTVCMNTIIMSLLFQNTAETLRFIMVDPKRVELTLYNGIPHLLTPVITNTQKTVNALKWTIGEMDRRFEVLAAAGNRDINSYNARHPSSKIPAIIFVIDELADLMATAASEVESGIIRLAQMARAVGIHLIVATQRPSVDVITGLMKANIPGRIAFSVASLIDSRTILDSPGAEKLLGRGDMLFQTAELSKPVRIQGAFISEDELKSVVDYLKGDEPPEYDESIVEKNNGTGTMSMFGGPSDDRDPLFNEAKAEIIRAGKASASFLQRKFKVGYARAARLLDELEAAGVIGPGEGAKPREILVTATEISDTMDAGGSLNVFDNTSEKDSDNEESLDSESEDDTKQN
ncbi:MAG: DNA translocase FtsK 4TM domain-containing protein [Candidatus Magasanikbacteria bacterium]|nr:DNA translocase FtsK 4TM domain-containing protein [Candidatus Magasanikbacteria bacterium]